MSNSPLPATPQDSAHTAEPPHHLTYKRNHEPTDQGARVPYSGFRYKDWYDIELVSGVRMHTCYPSSDGWHQDRGGYASDKEVAVIRLKPDHELHQYELKGEARIERNLRMFPPDSP